MAHDPTDLLADVKREEEEAEAKRIRLAQDSADIRWLMRQRPFRRFMWNLLEECGVYRTSFNRDALVMALMEGRRDVGLALVALMTAYSPDDFDLMARERREKQEMKAHGG
jgi:ABC-type phosphate transport system auxiliary subunit